MKARGSTKLHKLRDLKTTITTSTTQKQALITNLTFSQAQINSTNTNTKPPKEVL